MPTSDNSDRQHALLLQCQSSERLLRDLRDLEVKQHRRATDVNWGINRHRWLQGFSYTVLMDNIPLWGKLTKGEIFCLTHFVPVVLAYIIRHTACFGLFTLRYLQACPSRIKIRIYNFTLTLHETLKSQMLQSLWEIRTRSSNAVIKM